MASSTTRADLIALAARVEQAQGPDRELDAEIARAIGWKESLSGRWWKPPGGDDWNFVLPPFTASLDAALTLVPEGWIFAVHSGDDRGPPVAYCVPNMGRLPWPHWVDDINAATPALALTAAALRARAEDGNDG